MDLTPTIEAKSDQVDADDLMAGPRTVTITGIKAGSTEQPVQIMTDGWDRPYRPSKSMRRVLVACWGADGRQYVGRRMTLFRDPKIKYGGIAVGGTRISHLSNLERPITVALTISRGKKEDYKVQPLPDAPKPPSQQQIAACTDVERLKAWWHISDPQTRQLINARATELTTPTPAPDPQTGEIPTDDGTAFEQQTTPTTGPDPWADQTQES
jgi:hypothetical protein